MSNNETGTGTGFSVIEVPCEKCGKYFKKPDIANLPLVNIQNICPSCRAMRALDKTKRIVAILREK